MQGKCDAFVASIRVMSRHQLTGMIGLSARTSSCGGEGERFLLTGGLGGGCAVVAAAIFFLADDFCRNLSMGPMAFASSSLAGGDDNTEESSESLMLWGSNGVVEVG